MYIPDEATEEPPVSAAVPFGPTGEVVYNRTYARDKEDGSRETWPETVRRVARGNLALVYGQPEKDWTWPDEVWDEYNRLCHYMNQFAIIPAGRHLWATGVSERQHLFNCHVAGWGNSLSDHFRFSFLRLMEGGGVGSNYSGRYTGRYGAPVCQVQPHVICDSAHADMAELHPYLSDKFIAESYPDLEVEDSREGWADALCDLIDTFYGKEESCVAGSSDVIYDVSGVRPSGSPLLTFGGTASGPAPLARMLLEVATILNRSFDKREFTPLDAMEIEHAIAECVVSGGNRRSARMSIVRWDDPHIFNFLECKKIPGLHWTTNISVEIDDEFLASLKGPGSTTNSMQYQAHAVHAMVVKGMLANGEPGYWNSSLSQKGEIGEIIATNPCGEIPLEAWENCNLGHVNMDYFWDKTREEMFEAHRLMTRFLIRATYGDVNDDGQRAKLARNRRIGLGHLGVQGYWAKRGVRYSDIPAYAPKELRELYVKVRQEAREYAFKLRIPEPVKVTTVAPTGSVAKLPGVSEGIHPIYARYFERRVRFSKRDDAQFQTVMEAMSKGFTVEDDVYDMSGMTAVVVYPTEDILLSQVRSLGFPDDVVESTEDLSVSDMLNVQRVYQECWADNAVSYTVNIPEGSMSEPELYSILAAYLPYLKGTTIMVDASRPQAPYTRITREQYEAAVATAIEDGTNEECSSGACPIR
jgi:adenosylcobalamin-dependent ribonucleoside-triphosphate reductase